MALPRSLALRSRAITLPFSKTAPTPSSRKTVNTRNGCGTSWYVWLVKTACVVALHV